MTRRKQMDPTNKKNDEVGKFLEDVLKQEYYDILSTEDCFVDEEKEIGDNIILGYN